MSAYQELTLKQKQAAAIASQREQTIVCPRCEAQLMPIDLVGHLEQRCTGRTAGSTQDARSRRE